MSAYTFKQRRDQFTGYINGTLLLVLRDRDLGNNLGSRALQFFEFEIQAYSLEKGDTVAGR